MKVKLLGFAMVAIGLAAIGVAQMGGMHQGKMKMMDSRSKPVKAAVKTIMHAKKKAIMAGTYDCCLKHPCTSCEITMGSCPCGTHAAMDMPVCNECKGGWYAGDGRIPGKTADQIKTMPRGMKMR